MLGRVLDEMERQGTSLSSLRHLSYGGGRMPVELIERAMVTLPDVNYVNAYGLTETSSTIAVLTPDDHRESAASDDPAVRRRLGSVGRPLPSIELEIRGPEGDVLPAGERGEIYVRGEQVAGEYLGRSVLTDDGWFPTNDAGYVDEHGFLYLEGRLDDVIVRGAENLSPGEIEETLLAHPAVAEAAVVGVPDPEWGEAVAAAVVLAEGEQATRGRAAGLGPCPPPLDEDAAADRLLRGDAVQRDRQAVAARAAQRPRRSQPGARRRNLTSPSARRRRC